MAVAFFFHDDCVGGWRLLWTYCQDEALHGNLTVTLTGHELLTWTDFCELRFNERRSCTRAMVEVMFPLLARKQVSDALLTVGLFMLGLTFRWLQNWSLVSRCRQEFGRLSKAVSNAPRRIFTRLTGRECSSCWLSCRGHRHRTEVLVETVPIMRRNLFQKFQECVLIVVSFGALMPSLYAYCAFNLGIQLLTESLRANQYPSCCTSPNRDGRTNLAPETRLEQTLNSAETCARCDGYGPDRTKPLAVHVGRNSDIHRSEAYLPSFSVEQQDRCEPHEILAPQHCWHWQQVWHEQEWSLHLFSSRQFLIAAATRSLFLLLFLVDGSELTNMPLIGVFIVAGASFVIFLCLLVDSDGRDDVVDR